LAMISAAEPGLSTSSVNAFARLRASLMLSW
jgi:hypothetical protein